jgi:hypothetical protein
MAKPQISKESLEKLRKKRLFKLNGKVEESFWLFVGKTLRIVLYKGTGAKKSIYAFTAFGEKAKLLSEYKKNDRLKVWFKIDTKKVDKNYFNNLIIEEFDYWPVNEEKDKKKAYKKKLLDDHNYKQSSALENEGFLNHGQGPYEDQM